MKSNRRREKWKIDTGKSQEMLHKHQQFKKKKKMIKI